jgi:hypothetical protein
MRRKTGRRRGRPRDPHARRRQTTRAGRRGLVVVDKGSPEMVARKRQVAKGSPGPIELIDAVGVLRAHGLVDLDELMTLRLCENWIARVRQARGLTGVSPAGLWATIVSGQGGVVSGRHRSSLPIDAHPLIRPCGGSRNSQPFCRNAPARPARHRDDDCRG